MYNSTFSRIFGCAAALAVLLLAPGAFAQAAEEGNAPAPDSAPDPEPPSKVTDARGGISAIVRGLYAEARVGVGLMVVTPEVEPDEFNPGISGSEGMGVGTLVNLSVGYDVTDTFALELFGGGLMAAGTRSDKVRDVQMLTLGVAGRLGIPMSSRLIFTVAPGVGYVSASNAIEPAKAGIALMVRSGLEYFVHVRHFSVGVEAVFFAPVSPLRAFVGVTPTVKYTF